MKIRKEKENKKQEIKVLLTFLRRTKEGKYSTIDKNLLPNSIRQDSDWVVCEDQYNYGLS